MHQQKKKFLSLKDILPQAIEWIRNPPKDQLPPIEKIRRKWSSLVGPHLASKSEPFKIFGKRLIISVPSSVWANEIDFMKVTILERIQHDPEIGLAVEEIRFQTVTSRSGSRGLMTKPVKSLG